MRGGEAPAGMRQVTIDRDGAHHYISDDRSAPVSPRDQQRGAPAIDFAEIAEHCRRRITTTQLSTLADELGVCVNALKALGTGWANADELRTLRPRWQNGIRPVGSFVVPERDAGGQIIGLSLRAPDGRKSSPKGAKRGLIIPSALDNQIKPVLIVEGASDVAACLTLGLSAIGRASAKSDSDKLAELLCEYHPDNVLVLGERDQKDNGDWPGRDGAQHIAYQLANAWHQPVRWVLPPEPAKDIRSWLQQRVARGLNLTDAEACRVAGVELLEMIRYEAQLIEPERNGTATRGKHESYREVRRKSQATEMVELAEQAFLFHSGDDDPVPYAGVEVDSHWENWRIYSGAFRRWLGRCYYIEHGKVPSMQAIQNAQNALAGQAIYDGPELPVAVRLADHEGNIYLDLADSEWRAVEITATRWRIVESKALPVRFIRRSGMLPLPAPKQGGSFDALRPLVNIPDDEQWRLFIAWLVAAMRPIGPYPVLIVNGEQGSAKSTLCRYARALIDPNKSPRRRPPRDERDLMIAATNSWLVTFDNLSGIAPNLSDALCSLATGGGFATRKLHTDNEEVLFAAQRPVLMNGIDEIATRPDLLDRAVQLSLPTISDAHRRSEAELDRAFDEARPAILGALLDAVSTALANHERIHLNRLPRMADFARWVVAAESALPWQQGAFLETYFGQREAAHDLAIEASPIGSAILGLMHHHNRWAGTATELLAELEAHHTSEAQRKRKGWPSSPKAMSNALRRLAPNLRAIGISFHPPMPQGKSRRRVLQLEKGATRSSAALASSANEADAPSLGARADDFHSKADGLHNDALTNRPLENPPQCPRTGTADMADETNGVLPEDSKSNDADEVIL